MNCCTNESTGPHVRYFEVAIHPWEKGSGLQDFHGWWAIGHKLVENKKRDDENDVYHARQRGQELSDIHVVIIFGIKLREPGLSICGAGAPWVLSFWE